MAKPNNLEQPPAPAVGKARQVLFRLLAVLLAVFALATLEGVLRLTDVGWDARFLTPIEGRPGGWSSNPRFGWRYFPTALARTPVPLELEHPKDPEMLRIFVLGGSAAMGTPEPAFGLPRVLEHLLRQRYPDQKFEVFNAAMAAINSHVVLEIAKDCARFEPDVFVLYLGNNEVVGPFGAATVFSPFSPNLTAIRAGSKVKELRLGQLAAQLLDGGREQPAEWRGMEMFLDQQLAADDSRLENVYEHFRRNLEDLLDVAADADAEVILSTVATNRLDSPPFASLHRPDLTTNQRAEWQRLVDQGNQAANQGEPAGAIESYRAAMGIDDRHAELHYRLGQIELQAGDPAAKASLDLARDLDALRFRADSRINTILREVAAAQDVELVDAATLLDAADPAAVGIAGAGLFFEHVHLRFAGNLRLAEAFADRLARVLGLPEATQTEQDLTATLPWTAFDHHALEAEMLELTGRPPFTAQLGYAERQRRAGRQVADLARRLDPPTLASADAAYEQALAKHPDDLLLASRYALLLGSLGRHEPAVEMYQQLVDRLPRVLGWRSNLAFALADAGQYEAAQSELEKVRTEDSDPATYAAARAEMLEKQGGIQAAVEALQQAANTEPPDATVLYNLGTLHLRQGQPEAARQALRRLLEIDPGHARGHLNLGAALEQLGRGPAAIETYRRAIELRPDLALAFNSLGYALAEAGDFPAAERAYQEGLEVDPGLQLAWFNLGDLKLSTGRPAEALKPYRQGLALDPSNTQARYNLAAALQAIGLIGESADQLQQLLDSSPDHLGALNNLGWLLATERRVSDPPSAVVLAERAARLTNQQAPEILETLSVALAANGRQAESLRVAEQALKLARSQGKLDLARSLEGRLAGR